MTSPRPQADSSCCGSSTTTRRALITGGGGYLGFRLATALAKHGTEVVLLDIAPPPQALPSGVTFFAGSVAEAAAVDAAFAGSHRGGSDSPGGPLDVVFHVASYGMSGRELRDPAKIFSVNVGGTQNILSACLRYGVPRLVYVSTCNVIFVGRPISGGDESSPYPPPSAYKDAYSATKAQAERLVREANESPLLTPPPPPAEYQEPGTGTEDDDAGMSDQEHGSRALRGRPTGHDRQPADAAVGPAAGTRGVREQQQQQQQHRQAGAGRGAGLLYTCCIRSTGIWGPGETRHQPRVIRMVRSGLFQATFGDPASRGDWVHVDNLVQILMLAERNLRLSEPSAGPKQSSTAGGDAGGGNGQTVSPVAGGQVYYASDGEPINSFLHFKPLITGLGYRYPSLNIPFAPVYALAWLIEYAWPLLSQLVADPPLTRMEVGKCCIEHWFDISKARRELGYKPVSYDRSEVVKHMAAGGWAAASATGELLGGVASSGSSGKARRLLGMDHLLMWAVAMAMGVLLLAAAYGAGGASLQLQ